MDPSGLSTGLGPVFEPEAFRVQGRRSTGLSYGPMIVTLADFLYEEL